MTITQRHSIGVLLLPIVLLTAAEPLGARGLGEQRAEVRNQSPSGDWRLVGHDNLRSAIIEIDPSSGRARTIGPTGWDSRGSGMAFSSGRVRTPTGELETGTLMGIIRDASSRDDHLVAIDLDSGRAEKITRALDLVTPHGMAFGADGATIHVVDHGGHLWALDTTSGALRDIGPLVDASGHRYDGDNLDWDPASGRFITVLERGQFAHERVALIDPTSGRVEPIDTIVDRFSLCSIARSPVEIDGPGGRKIPAGSLFFVDGRSHHLMALEVDTVARRLGALMDIGPVGPESSGSVCGSAFVNMRPEAPTPTPSPTPSPTRRPDPTDTAVPEPTPTARTCICESLRRRVPASVISDALAQPERYNGWQQPLNPARPPGPDNPLRTCLALRNPNRVYHPLFNSPLWVVGCR